MTAAADIRGGAYHNVVDAGQAWQALSGLSVAELVPSIVKTFEASPQSGQIIYFDPDSIQADPATYQFRSGGDKKNGVTKKGKYEGKRWDAVLHGDPILVHERVDGSLFVADGHHRLELAKRTNAEGAGPGRIAAQVLREADGYTPEDVRVIAAYKNMQHGHTNVVDAAKVFKEVASGRVNKELLPQLQMDKGNLTLSYRLSKLSDNALTQIASGDVPAEMAAQVADKLADPARQEAVMKNIHQKLYHAEASQPYAQCKEFHKLPEPCKESSTKEGKFASKVTNARKIQSPCKSIG
jgi:ParB-like chromosome segregation protein Spo0J